MGAVAGGSYGKRYEVLRYEGAEGPVKTYVARDVALEREVVLKVFKREVLEHEERRDRLVAETRSLSRVESPHVVPLYDYGVRGDVAFAVMARVEGLTLPDYVQRQRSSARDVAGLGAQLAAGLAAAHEVGVLHRDVTPERVLVTPDGTVKLTSFGLALYVGARPGGGVTGSGYLMGTAGYVAPELYAGAPSSPAADVFAAAATIYRTLTGRLPVPVEALATFAEGGRAPAITPPSSRVPGADAELDRVLLAALELDPARRTREAEELRGGLLAWSQGSADPRPAGRARPSKRREPPAAPPREVVAGDDGDEAWARRAAAWLVAMAVLVPLGTVTVRELGRRSAALEPVAPVVGAREPAVAPAGPSATPPLIVAVAEGDVGQMRSLLEGGADPNAPDAAGDTALHVAARRADDFLFGELLARGADPTRQNGRGETPLDAAARRGMVRPIVDAAVKGFGLKPTPR